MSKLIETALPLAEVNQAAIGEKNGKIGSPANMHMWWGRSPEASSIAALAAAVMDYSEESVTEDMILLAGAASGDIEALGEIQRRLHESGSLPLVWDAFSGFGGIPIAAQKLGMKTAANDLNPVAALLTKAAVDFPSRFASLPPVHPGTPQRVVYSGAEGLAEDVQFYGEWMENQARKRLEGLYPQTESGETPFAWLWVRTVKCPNPACNCHIPLGNSFILDKSGNSQVWAEPVVKDGEIHFDIHESDCPSGKESNKIGSYGARFRCPVCGEIMIEAYIKKKGWAHELGAEMMAVVTNVGGKRAFLVPDEAQYSAAAVQRPEDVPHGEISSNTRWFSPPGYGFTDYADLFTSRQLLMLTTFSDLVREAQDMASSAALTAGMSAAGGSLMEGGSDAVAYGQAIGVYLAFVVDKLASNNSSMCSWRASCTNLRNTFRMNSIPMVWTFAEGNPFSSVSGNYKNLLASVVSSLEHLICGIPAVVTQDNALTMEHPKESLICTELPYYRDMGYADLSDFYYIWLRRSLKETFPQMFSPVVTPKEELSTVSTYYGVSKDDAEEKYRADMEMVCEKLYASCSEDYPALLFYCFRKNDMECMTHENTGRNESAWEFMLESLLATGFSISAVWPMRSDPASEKADSTRVLIVAGKGSGRSGQVTRRGFITSLKHELPAKVHTVLSGHVLPEDEFISFMGQGLSVFTKYQTVLNADGTAMCVHDALQIIALECENEITKRKTAESEKDLKWKDDEDA